MGLKNKLIVFLTGVFCFAGCSSTSWVVQDDVMDPNDFQLVKSNYYLESTNPVTPNQPIVHFNLKSANTYRFSTRVRTERYIQRYRPRLSFALLGMAGAGLSYYAALSDDLLQQPTTEQKYALMGAGGLLTGLSFINMKPIGEPAKTGEFRLLRKTGEITEVDTTLAFPYSTEKPTIRISHAGKTLIEDSEWEFEGQRVSINIAEEINAGIFNENPEESILVEVEYDSLKASRTLHVSDIYEQFAIVNSHITALRNAPDLHPNNVLTDLARGSQLKFISTQDGWHKVYYGISETYIAAKDVELVWRPSEFAADLSVYTIPNVPFGSVDVEQNIPVLGTSNLNSSAFIISNFDYKDELTERLYGERDAKLMEEYFIQGFGIRGNRIVKAINISNERQADRAYSRLASSIEKGQRLTIYLSGYAEFRDSNLYLIGSGSADERQPINLHKLFEALSKLNVSSILAFADLDIINPGSEDILRNLSGVITEKHHDSAVIFSSRPGQRSRIYSSPTGEKKRHSIFTYFLADAMKKGNMNVSFLFNHLDRNVAFTSRSIYDLPQNPMLFGNKDLPLVN